MLILIVVNHFPLLNVGLTQIFLFSVEYFGHQCNARYFSHFVVPFYPRTFPQTFDISTILLPDICIPSIALPSSTAHFQFVDIIRRTVFFC